MEKVLVSGVSGFIGMHCAKQLLDKGYKVVGTTRSASKHDEVMAAIGHENLSLVNADLYQMKTGTRLLRVVIMYYMLHLQL